MTDNEAINILQDTNHFEMSELNNAVSHAIKRFYACRWYDYDEKDFAENAQNYGFNFGKRVVLGVRYSDGSCGSMNGVVLLNDKNELYLEIEHYHKSRYNEDAVIEKFMAYPDYNG